MPHFFFKLIAPRPTFAVDMNDAEKKMMQEHFLYWKGRQDKDEVAIFGPVMDAAGPYGMGIDEAGARALAAGDPAMKADCGFKCEVHSMRAVMRETTN